MSISKPRKRSRRIGLLTETERQFLKKEIQFSSKQKSKFFKSILTRMEACKDDFNIFFDARKIDKSIEGWCSAHFHDLYNLGQAIHLRNRLQLPPAFLDEVKFKVPKVNGKNKGVRYYWLGKSIDHRGDFAKVLDQSSMYVKIRPLSVRKSISEAYRKGLLPKNEENAITIDEIKLRLKNKITF